MAEVALGGVTPTPLLRYLVALGVFRILADQHDPTTRGWWTGGHFRLGTHLDEAGIRDFFLHEFRPTPIVSPWNGSSGFDPKSAPDCTEIIAATTDERFAAYRRTISTCREILAEVGASGEKEDLLRACRNRLPDEAIAWLDAAVVLRSESPAYPPLLGTGGNDGRFEFSRNYMQRLAQVLGLAGGKYTAKQAAKDSEASPGLLVASLFGTEGPPRRKGETPGQFDPVGFVDVNASSDGEDDSRSNPWEFVLALEGAITFSAGLARKAGSSGTQGTAAFPFTVRAGLGGYTSAGAVQEVKSARNELWLPVWSRPATYPEIAHIFTEGRADVSRRRGQAGSAVDFVRAVATLGTDRGIDTFERVAFVQRNGKMYVAVPAGRWHVAPNPQGMKLVADLDPFLDGLRRTVTGGDAPASLERSMRRLEGSIMDYARRRGPDRLQEILAAAAGAEAVIARSKRLRAAGVAPLSISVDWVLPDSPADDGSAAWSLACAIASLRSVGRSEGLRTFVEPVEREGARIAFADVVSPDVVWNRDDPVSSLGEILLRRLRMYTVERVGATQGTTAAGAPIGGRIGASAADIGLLLAGRVDETHLGSLAAGLAAVRWPRDGHGRGLHVGRRAGAWPADLPRLDPAFVILAASLRPEIVDPHGGGRIATESGRLLQTGDVGGAVRAGLHRLRLAGYDPFVGDVASAVAPGRLLAALAFPMALGDLRQELRRFAVPPTDAPAVGHVASAENVPVQEGTSDDTQ